MFWPSKRKNKGEKVFRRTRFFSNCFGPDPVYNLGSGSGIILVVGSGQYEPGSETLGIATAAIGWFA